MLEFCADTKEVGIMVEASRMAKPEQNMIDNRLPNGRNKSSFFRSSGEIGAGNNSY